MSRGVELLKAYNNRHKNREAEDASLSSSSRGKELYNRYMGQRMMSDLDDFNRSVANDERYSDGWHSQSDMDRYINTTKQRYSQLSDLANKYGDFDPSIKTAQSQYMQNLNSLNKAKDFYSNYLNADAFNKAKRTWELDEKYKGKSYEDIRKAYDTTVDQDEKDYLKNYTKYSSLADFDKALADRTNGFDRNAIREARSNYATMNAFDEYKDLLNAKDFNKYSDPTGLLNTERGLDENGNPTLTPMNKRYGADVMERGVGSDMYNKAWLYELPEEMQRVGAYLYQNPQYGADAYKEFINKVSIQASAENSQKEAEAWSEWANQHPVVGTVANTISRPLQSAGATLEEGASLLTGAEYNPFRGFAGWGRQINESQKELSESFANNFDSEIGQTLARIGYNAATEGITSRIGQMTTGGLYNLVMGGGVLAQTYGDALLSGMSKEKALGKAVAAGAIETATEAFGMERAFKWIPDKTWWSNMLSQGLAEGSEEVVGNIANAIYDQLANGKNSELQGEYQRLLTQGYSEKDAIKMTAWKFTLETLEEAGTAALSAGLSGGAQVYNTSKLGKNVDFSRLAEAVNTYNPDSEAAQLYNKLLGGYTEDSKVPNWNKGMVAQQAYSDARNAYNQAVENGDAQAIDNALMNRYALDEAFKTREEIAEDKKNNLVNKAVQSVRDKFNKTTESVSGSEQSESTKVSENENIATSEMEKALNQSYRNKISKGYTELENQLFDTSVNEEKLPLYKANFDYVINAAHRQTDLEEVLQHVTPSVMKHSAAINIYNTIWANDAEVGRVATEANSKVISKWDGEYSKKGLLTVNVDKKDLTKEDKRILGLVTALTHMGMDINVIKNKDEENGWVTDKNNRITLNLAAQYFKSSDPSKGRYVVNTLAHESTHWMENVLGKAEFGNFKNLIRSSVGVNKWNQMVGLEIARAHEDGSEMDIDTAESEATARFCEDMFNDMSVADKIFEKASKSTIERIANAVKEFFTKIRNDLKEWMKGYDSMSDEARLLRQLDKSFKEVQDQWAEMFKRALAVNQVQEYQNVTEEALDAVVNDNQEAAEDLVGNVVDSHKSSIKLNDTLGEKSVEANNKYHNVNPMVLNRALALRKGKVVARLLKLMNYLPDDIEGDIITKNGSYGRSVEHALICVRSLVNNWFVDKVSEELRRPLSIEEQIVASEVLAQKVSQRECQYCYVAADRRAFKAAFKVYLDEVNELQDKALANREQYQKEVDFIQKNWKSLKSISLNKEKRKEYMKDGKGKNLKGLASFLHGREMTKDMLERYVHAVSDALEGREKLEGKHLTTDAARIEASKNPTLKWYVKDSTLYAKRASHAKLTSRTVKIDGKKVNLEYIAYNGNILKFSDDLVEHLNKEYGLRLYSDSDYVPAFILEDIQVVTDAAVRGLKMLAYTKDLGFARVFAPSQMNINVSTYGVLEKAYKNDKELARLREKYQNDKNEKTRKAYLDALTPYVQSDAMQGAEWADVKKIRNDYKNVGAIFVAYNDDLVEWALAQDWIDVVIPYHVVYSQGTKEFFEYTDYKSEQGDKKTKNWIEGDETLIPPTMHENDFEKYKEALEKNHLTMRFERWADNPNYMKLVNETRRSYKETPAVQPEFDYDAVEEEINRIEFEGTYGFDRGINSLEEQERTFADKQADAVKLIEEGKTTKEDLEAYLGSSKKSRKVDSEGNALSEGQEKYFEKSAVRDKNGNLLLVKHGTKDLFYIFNPKEKGGQNGNAEGYGIYFSDDPEVTERYGDIQLEGYLNITKPAYDDKKTIKRADLKKLIEATVKAESEKWEEDPRDSWISNYVYTYDHPLNVSYGMVADQILKLNSNDKSIIQEVMAGMGINSYERAYEFYDILTNTLGFDGFIVKWHHSDGESNVFVAFDSEQFKDRDNLNPTDNPDRRYSKKVSMPQTALEKAEYYTYDSLINQPDLHVVRIEGKESFDRDNLKKEANQNCLKNGFERNGKIYTHVDRLDMDVQVSDSAWNHGLDRRIKIISRVMPNIGDILKNSILINELNPREDNVQNTYVLLGVAQDSQGKYVVSFVVNKATKTVETINELYSANTKKDSAAFPPELSGSPESLTESSDLSVSELLDIVNNLYPDILPEDVLRHYGNDRRPNKSKLGKSALYSRRVADTTNEILNQTERVRKDAAVLSKDIRAMAEEFDFAKRTPLTKNRANLVADRLKKMPHVSADKDEIIEGLYEAYSEISQIFADNTKASDKAEEIIAVCNNLAERITDAAEPIVKTNDSDADMVFRVFSTMEEQKEVAEAIYDNYWTVSLSTLGDAASEKTKALKEKHAKAMHDLRLSRDRALDKLRKEKNDIIKQIREDRDHKLEEYKMYRDWQEAEHKQRAEKKAYVEKITDTATTLMDWLKKNDGKNMKSVPDALKAPVTALLESIDFSSKQLLGMVNGKYSGMSTRKDRAIAESLNTIKDYLYRSRYNDTEDENYFDIPAEIVAEMEELSKVLYQIAENNNGFVLNKMSTQELDVLSNILTVLKTSITHINKRFNGKGKIDEVAIPDIVDNRVLGQKENNKFKAFFEWKNTLPQYAFEHLGKGATEMFQEIKDGWSKFAFHVQSIKDFAKETYKGEEYKKWSENVTEYTINGHKIKMTDTQRMSLYCLAKRDQALQHMFNGGIEVAPYRGKNGKLVEQAENVVLTQADIDTITGTLTDRQIEVAQALQNFMNTTCSDWMNEVTMKRWGIRGATEENYFPINVDDTSLVDTGEPRDMPKSIFKLLNMGFTKPLNEKATNPIVVDDIVNVFITHSTDMAKYNSLALPVLDMHRYYNFKMKTDEGDIYNMKKSIQTAYGRDAQKYITKFLLDLNANREESRAGDLFKLARGYKVAAVAGNLQVAALQPVAVMRAKMYLSNGDLIKGFTKVPEGVEEMLKYSGIAVWKDLSLFDTNVARGIDSQIKQNDSIKDKFVEKTMKLAELADKMTWGAIWSACKNEQYRNGLRGEELIKATAEEFENVIYHTQVVDSTMTRSEIMRGNDPYSQMVTSFMSEPTISMNLLQDAGVRYFQDARRYGKAEAFRRNGKHIAQCAYIYALNAAVEAVLRGLMGKYRDWDEEPEEMLENMWKEFMMNLNPLGNLPIARDIVSKLQGYNVERMDMASWTSLVNAKNSWEKIVKGEKDLDYKTVYRTMQALSQFTGIPISSLMRDGAALWNDTIGRAYPSLKIE